MMCIGSAQAFDKKDLMSCSLAGFFKGEESEFLYDISTGILAENNLFEARECQEKLQAGVALGQYYLKHRKHKYEKDLEVLKNAAIFRAKIRRFIIDGAGLN